MKSRLPLKWTMRSLRKFIPSGIPILCLRRTLWYYTSENPKGTILGYVNSTSIGEGEGAYIYTFDDDDVINLIHPILYTDGTTEYVKIVQEDILASNLKLNYQNIDYSKVDIVSFIKVEDIYGNTYETEPKFYE